MYPHEEPFFCLGTFLEKLLKFRPFLITDSMLQIKVLNETIFQRTTLCVKVYLPCFKSTLHAPKIRAVVQTSFLRSVHVASVEIFHHRILQCYEVRGEYQKSKQDKKRQGWQVMLAKISMRNHFGCNLLTKSIQLLFQVQLSWFVRGNFTTRGIT